MSPFLTDPDGDIPEWSSLISSLDVEEKQIQKDVKAKRKVRLCRFGEDVVYDHRGGLLLSMLMV